MLGNVFVAVFNAKAGLFGSIKPLASAVVVNMGGVEEGVKAGLFGSIKPLVSAVVVDMGGAEEGRAEGKGVSTEFIELIGPFRFQCWSIPKTGHESDGGLPEKSIPEKLNGKLEADNFNVPLSASQLKELKEDVDFRNCVFGESGLGGCATPMAGL